MHASKITTKGQVTVPKVVRETLALLPGDRISFVIHDDGTVTVEAETVDLSSLRGAVGSGGQHVHARPTAMTWQHSIGFSSASAASSA